jgi:hypothetical protein
MIFYADTDVCQHHLTQIGIDFTCDFESFVQTPGPKTAVFHVPFPWEGGYGDLFIGRLERVYDSCEQVIVICSELHNRTYDFIQRWDRPKMVYFLCGYLNRRPNHSRVYTWMDWLVRTRDFYVRHPTVLEELSPYTVKPKSFDILLGQPRTHRDMVYSYAVHAGWQDQTVLTYMRDFNQGLYDHDFNDTSFQERSASEWLWDGVSAPKDPLHFTIEPVEFHGEQISLSQVLPVGIYNQTAYTVVAETNFMNSYSFFTEKIVKPILARRLFVVFSGQHYLRNLHNAGFKTFSNIIDESYDEEPDITKRYSMIFEQIQYLMHEPQEKIFEEIKYITEYNYNHMITHDWLGEYFRVLRAVLLDHTTHGWQDS